MALVYTPAPEMGQPCPDFNLPSVDGKKYSLKDFKSPVLCVMFICNHCPYVKAVESRILSLAREMMPKGADFVAICSNDGENYPEDSFENLKSNWLAKKFPFPYLHDETQEIAKKFGAVCTPDFFVYDKVRKLSYRGRLDDNWKDSSAVKKQEMKEAIELLLAGSAVPREQKPSMGCSIKWL